MLLFYFIVEKKAKVGKLFCLECGCHSYIFLAELLLLHIMCFATEISKLFQDIDTFMYW